jgi:uncharacterized lipoprotein
MTRRTFFPLLWALALAACMATRMSPYTPAEKATDAAPERLYAAAEGVLLDRGFLIAERNPEAGTLKTEQRTLVGDEVFRSEFRYAISVETRGGKLKVAMSCSRGDKSAPESCGDDRPEKLVLEQERLVDAILAEASAAPQESSEAAADAATPEAG